MGLLLFLSGGVTATQDDATPTPDAPPDTRIPLAYGIVATGELNARTPQERYVFEALRCDFVSLKLTPTSGTLDPVILVANDDGAVLFEGDDSAGELGVTYEPLAIPQSGLYTVVVARFGYSLGSTSGSYELLIERIGNGSASGCGMRYGDTVFNSIDNTTPEVFYFFRASEGDMINVQMLRRSGGLDTHVRVVDSRNVVIGENDDTLTSTDSEIQGLLIPQDGTYYIIASRYGLAAGQSAGNFMLTLEEAAHSGLGNSPSAPLPIRADTTVEGEITAAQFARYYRFTARQDDLISISMTRVSGTIDAYLILTNAALQELVSNDDAGDSQNSRISEYVIPADGTYYIIATRFEQETGTTTGRYRLTLAHHGNAFDEVPTDIRKMAYGATVTGRIDEITPGVRYVFWGEEGDTIRVSMNRGDGDLDPYLSILSETGRTLISDDDSGGNKNAMVGAFTLPYTGIYYIEATRYPGDDNPNTRGSFVLVLVQRMD